MGFFWRGGKPERTGPEKHETRTCLTAGEEAGSGFLHNVAISDSSAATHTVTDGRPTSRTPDALTCVSACLCGTHGRKTDNLWCLQINFASLLNLFAPAKCRKSYWRCIVGSKSGGRIIASLRRIHRNIQNDCIQSKVQSETKTILSRLSANSYRYRILFRYFYFTSSLQVFFLKLIGKNVQDSVKL